MKNLAGDENCDKVIKKELSLTSLFIVEEKGKGEVPYNYIGVMGPWIFTRAWNYWIATIAKGKQGLPLDIAMKMHYEKRSDKPNMILGETIRPGGHCGCLPPDEYGALPILTDELNNNLKKLGYEEINSTILNKKYIKITFEEISKLNKEGKISVPFYVNCYHIDDQFGLNSLVHVIIKHLKEEIWG
jgi:hypothetical protein